MAALLIFQPDAGCNTSRIKTPSELIDAMMTGIELVRAVEELADKVDDPDMQGIIRSTCKTACSRLLDCWDALAVIEEGAAVQPDAAAPATAPEPDPVLAILGKIDALEAQGRTIPVDDSDEWDERNIAPFEDRLRLFMPAATTAEGAAAAIRRGLTRGDNIEPDDAHLFRAALGFLEMQCLGLSKP